VGGSKKYLSYEEATPHAAPLRADLHPTAPKSGCVGAPVLAKGGASKLRTILGACAWASAEFPFFSRWRAVDSDSISTTCHAPRILSSRPNDEGAMVTEAEWRDPEGRLQHRRW